MIWGVAFNPSALLFGINLTQGIEIYFLFFMLKIGKPEDFE